MAMSDPPRPAPSRMRPRHLADAARHLAHDTARIARFFIGIGNAAFIGIFSAAQQPDRAPQAEPEREAGQ